MRKPIRRRDAPRRAIPKIIRLTTTKKFQPRSRVSIDLVITLKKFNSLHNSNRSLINNTDILFMNRFCNSFIYNLTLNDIAFNNNNILTGR